MYPGGNMGQGGENLALLDSYLRPMQGQNGMNASAQMLNQ